ncbi:hypothetical protein SHELI_v1c09160 [Spiroplasma helicoides]|uniref:Lipoprotein n=1 Tax=Spiroplasma helicoides TaxID=216938 RepID=A0A1B3SLQ0_9MOLU|nr:lipoprotein [Spiroplasma helicoides]AOG60865.1 hypothetical protein SHELI_v1c09160 [Spiroplasma helicoides]
MKKLLSLLAATGLVATSGSVAVACNKKDQNNVKELTYSDGKKDADVVAYLSDKNKTSIIQLTISEPLKVSENKLDVDYKDTKTGDYDGFGNSKELEIEGTLISFKDMNMQEQGKMFGSFTELFKELKDLNLTSKQDGDNSVLTIYFITIKGQKGNDNFDLAVIEEKVIVDKDGIAIKDPELSKIYKKNISLK